MPIRLVACFFSLSVVVFGQTETATTNQERKPVQNFKVSLEPTSDDCASLPTSLASRVPNFTANLTVGKMLSVLKLPREKLESWDKLAFEVLLRDTWLYCRCKDGGTLLIVRQLESNQLLAEVSNRSGADISLAKVGGGGEGAKFLDKTERTQNERKKLIDDLIAKGVFQKLEIPGTVPRVWVRPLFHELDFDQKEAFIGVVFSYYFDGTNETDFVRVFDSRSNKEIGTYSMVNNWGRGGLNLK